MWHRIICIAVITAFLSPLPAFATGAVHIPKDGCGVLESRELHGACRKCRQWG